MNPLENIKLAFSSIQSNFVRSLLTMLIIAVGITCLVGILTAIDSILISMSDNFSRLGANSFSVRSLEETIRAGGGRRTKQITPNIVFDQAINFKNSYQYGSAKVSINGAGVRDATIKFANKKTNPNVTVLGIDDNFIATSGFDIASGRNFTPDEVMATGQKVLLGSDIVKQLFNDDPNSAVGQTIFVNTQRYKVIGTLKSKGSSSGGSQDLRVFIPLYNFKVLYGFADKNYNVSVAVNRPEEMDESTNHAIGVMRNVRKLRVTEPNDFEIRKSDGILNTLKDMTSTLRWSTIIIAMLTLLGASIGLMNIMLVSVTERTKEIGIRKALGATRSNILIQFLVEAIAICLFGGVIGVLLGILMGYGVSVLVEGRFVIPWLWMALGFTVCIVVGLISGLYPALKASSLDPIEALRYE